MVEDYVNKINNSEKKTSNKPFYKSKKNWLIGTLASLGLWGHGNDIQNYVSNSTSETIFEQVTLKRKISSIKEHTHYLENKKMYDNLFIAIENIESLNQISQIQVMFSTIIEDVKKVNNTKYSKNKEQQNLVNKYISNLEKFEKELMVYLTQKLSENTKNN
jgi:hypothetical protein